MIHALTVIDTIILAMTALVMCICSFKVLSEPDFERERNNFTIVFFMVGIIGIVLGIGLLWV